MLDRINAAYESLASFREMRRRAKRYAYGRQWEDYITVDGVTMREADYISAQGSVPLKNNLIRRLVRSVLGVFRNSYSFPSPAALGLDPEKESDRVRYDRLREMASANRLDGLYARTMEEFLISGMAIHRKTPWSGLPDCGGRVSGFARTDFVAPDAFFIDPGARDFRGWDATLVGEIHDVDFATLCSLVASGQEDVERLAGIYHEAASRDSQAVRAGDFGLPPGAERHLLSPSAPGMCRVFEVWTLDCCERYRIHDRDKGVIYKMEAADYRRLSAKERKRLGGIWCCDKVWRYSFVAPTGETIAEGESPFPDGGHPYIWKAYPFIDGEIHSFVDDVIDQQRFTNRLITLYDWVLRSSAKGVLLFPQEAVPLGADMEQVVDEWSKFNGVIMYRSKGTTAVPQQVSGGSAHSGITELLNIQLKMFEDVSGVNSALQGKLESTQTSGTLFNSQMRQSMVSLADLLETFNEFILDCTRRDLALI